MSPDSVANRLLVITGDADQAMLLGRYFEDNGYQVSLAASGQDGLAQANARRPDVILLDATLPDVPGVEVFRALHSQPRTSYVPVLVIIGEDDDAPQHEILEAGVEDVIEKPLDVDILALRVRNLLRRSERDGLTEPRTGLPTGRLLEDRILTVLRDKSNCRIDIEIVGFGDFRDLHGFVNANEALRFTGNLIAEIVTEHGGPEGYVGHVAGTEYFVALAPLERGIALGEMLAERITDEMESFYSFVERERGYVLVDDGMGGQVKRPLMSARVMVAGETIEFAPGPESDNGDDDGFAW